jgi:hypothetical protein
MIGDEQYLVLSIWYLANHRWASIFHGWRTAKKNMDEMIARSKKARLNTKY